MLPCASEIKSLLSSMSFRKMSSFNTAILFISSTLDFSVASSSKIFLSSSAYFALKIFSRINSSMLMPPNFKPAAASSVMLRSSSSRSMRKRLKSKVEPPKSKIRTICSPSSAVSSSSEKIAANGSVMIEFTGMPASSAACRIKFFCTAEKDTGTVKTTSQSSFCENCRVISCHVQSKISLTTSKAVTSRERFSMNFDQSRLASFGLTCQTLFA